MADEPVKRKRGRPPLPPEEKERRAKEAKERRNAKLRATRAKRAAARDNIQPEFVGKITDKVIDQFEETIGLVDVPEEEAPQDPNLKPAPTRTGRAKGTKNKPKPDILSYKSSKKLEALGYDPIERQIEIYSLILTQMAAKDPKTGKPIIKVGSMAHATMLGHLRAINNDLTKYAYRPIPEKQEIENVDKVPTIINLTMKKNEDDDKNESDDE